MEQVAELAMRLGQQHLADYGAARSRHDFTQRQLLACLVLRAYLKSIYRGVLDVLAVSASLRQQLGLADKLPHFTTLQKFSARSQVLAIVEALVARIGQAAAQRASAPVAVAVDSTGLATSTASAYFRSRCGGPCRQWVKLSVVVLCGSLLSVGMVLDLGPSNDRVQVPRLLSQAQAGSRPVQLYADAGYDAEWSLAQSDVGRTPARAGLRTAMGGGKLLQRTEADDGRGVERPPTAAAIGRGCLPGAGLRPSPLGPMSHRPCFQQSNNVFCCRIAGGIVKGLALLIGCRGSRRTG